MLISAQEGKKEAPALCVKQGRPDIGLNALGPHADIYSFFFLLSQRVRVQSHCAAALTFAVCICTRLRMATEMR